MRLLSRALDQFGGKVETTFERTGLICKLSAALPENYTASVESDITRSTSVRHESGLAESVQEARRDVRCGSFSTEPVKTVRL